MKFRPPILLATSMWESPVRPASFLVLLLSLGVLPFGGSRRHVARASTTSVQTQSDQLWRTQTGLATFYGEDFQGQPMADGAPFDMDDSGVTASNRWPLGTRLLVRRVAGGPWDARLTPPERERYFRQRVIVTVADRGAFDHELDLSRAAFAELGALEEGVIRVQVEQLSPPSDPAGR
jgi:rare lipoprotein A (peptidoglycan hydrolase)